MSDGNNIIAKPLRFFFSATNDNLQQEISEKVHMFVRENISCSQNVSGKNKQSSDINSAMLLLVNVD